MLARAGLVGYILKLTQNSYVKLTSKTSKHTCNLLLCWQNSVVMNMYMYVANNNDEGHTSYCLL